MTLNCVHTAHEADLLFLHTYTTQRTLIHHWLVDLLENCKHHATGKQSLVNGAEITHLTFKEAGVFYRFVSSLEKNYNIPE